MKYNFKDVSNATERMMYISSIWLLVGLVMSLSSPYKRGFFTASLGEDINDLTSPPSNNYI